jgi:hypothetical protein
MLAFQESSNDAVFLKLLLNSPLNSINNAEKERVEQSAIIFLKVEFFLSPEPKCGKVKILLNSLRLREITHRSIASCHYKTTFSLRSSIWFNF